MMLSSAAQSFVTAPVSVDAQSMFTMTTGGGDSSEGATLPGSWEENRGSGFVGAFLNAAGRGSMSRRGRTRDGGLVERASETEAVSGLGDGRVV